MNQGSESGNLKAVGLLSGGLDSTLAAQLMLEQGIEVHAINFTSPFCTCTPKKAGCAAVITAVRELGDINLKQVALKDEYIVARNQQECNRLKTLSGNDCRILTPLNFTGPSVLLQGYALEEAVTKLLHYTSRMVPETAKITVKHRGKQTVIIREKVHE